MLFRLAFIIFISFLGHSTIAQNLIPNGDFEDHNKQECLHCDGSKAKFKQLMKGWSELNSSPRLCDCNYSISKSEKKYDYCRIENASCNFFQMRYMSRNIGWRQRGIVPESEYVYGGSSYLGTFLKEKLQVGKAYKMSFRLFIEDYANKSVPIDPKYPEHIGFNLYPDEVANKYSEMLPGNYFSIDTVIYNQWYEVEWTFKPSCELQYVVVGVFKSRDWVIHQNDFHDSRFYVDKLSLEEIQLGREEYMTTAMYCEALDTVSSDIFYQIPKQTIYFESRDSSLSIKYQLVLDSFADVLKKKPKEVFTICGYTDDIGKGNIALSDARVKSVLKYLKEKYSIPSFRFVQFARGDKEPVESNITDKGKARNRRVEIEQISTSIENAIYRSMILDVRDQNYSSAFKKLNLWQLLVRDGRKILSLVDPRIEALRKSKRWMLNEQKVLNSYEKFGNPTLAYSLDSLWTEDQYYRTLEPYVNNLMAYIHQYDDQDSTLLVNYGEYNYRKDSLNLIYVKNYLSKNRDEFPSLNEVSKRGIKALALVLIHSEDKELLLKYLPGVKELCNQGMLNWQYYAIMYDKWAVLETEKQYYGTQSFTKDNGHLRLQHSIDSTNFLRAQIGLRKLK